MLSRTCLLLTVCAVALSATTASAETLAEVKKKIQEKVSSYKSIQYKVEMTSDMEMPQASIKSTTKHSAEYLKKGDVIKARTETNTTAVQKFGETEQKMDTRAVEICDGEYWYSVIDHMGQKMASKRDVSPGEDTHPFNPEQTFKNLNEYFDVKLVGDETLDGKPVWVLEAKPLPGATPHDAGGHSRTYYEKKTGISIKSVSHDAAGKVISTSRVTDLKINEDIPEDRFVFKAPEGVTVVDQTQAASGQP